MKKIVFILFIMLVSSCQYKYNGPWQNNIYPAYWKYELYPSLSKCDDEKMEFINDIINSNANIDNKYLNSECLYISNKIQRYKNNSYNIYFDLLKENYNIIANFKRKTHLKDNNKLGHYIIIEYSGNKLKKNIHLIMGLVWEYDEQSKKWNLEDFFIRYS